MYHKINYNKRNFSITDLEKNLQLRERQKQFSIIKFARSKTQKQFKIITSNEPYLSHTKSLEGKIKGSDGTYTGKQIN